MTMNNSIELKDLYKLQGELDDEIARLHGVSYETTHDRRLLALIIELGELANETRCFKYWSNKGPSPKERIVDEYADGLHFLLSLGIPLNVKKTLYTPVKSSLDLTEQFHNLYKKAIALKDSYDIAHYEDAMQDYLNLAYSLDMSVEDIRDCYLAKLKVNHVRQDTNY